MRVLTFTACDKSYVFPIATLRNTQCRLQQAKMGTESEKSAKLDPMQATFITPNCQTHMIT